MSGASSAAPARPAARFTVPPGRSADAPPERRGLARDGVRLLVAEGREIDDRRFFDLPELLAPGDLLVVNTSATLPAAVEARRADGRIEPLHVSTTLDDGRWVVELRRPGSDGPAMDGRAGEVLMLPGGVRLELTAPYPQASAVATRLWTARATPDVTPASYLPRHGRPVQYRYLAGRFPLADHQTVYADVSGSAEMPSAGRPFTDRLLVRLMARGVAVAPLVLHAGVSSPELPEAPQPERFDVPDATARLVRATRAGGGRVVAVGTTVVRALESAADEHGRVRAREGWTDLVLGPDRPARVVDGLVTGLHPPEASHLLLLEAVAGPERVQQAYGHAAAGDYLWHEFGDSMLFLPARSSPPDDGFDLARDGKPARAGGRPADDAAAGPGALALAC